jgi:hypothetical protein
MNDAAIERARSADIKASVAMNLPDVRFKDKPVAKNECQRARAPPASFQTKPAERVANA